MSVSCKSAAYFQNTFSKEHLWVDASGYPQYTELTNEYQSDDK